MPVGKCTGDTHTQRSYIVYALMNPNNDTVQVIREEYNQNTLTGEIGGG